MELDFAQYDYNLQEIKETLDDSQITELLAELGGDPRPQSGAIVSRTICHCGGTHKLYYWTNTHLFRCFTDCGEVFDVFELVRKVKSRETGGDYSLPAAVDYVAKKFGYAKNTKEDFSDLSITEDIKYFNSYDRIKEIDKTTQTVELKTYDPEFLTHFPQPIILPWVEDNISKETMDYFGIRFDPSNEGIIIPHFDMGGHLIGVRERTLITEVADKYGKYLPMKVGKLMYNHPLSFNLYGLYQNKDNIAKTKKAIILESEKSVLQLEGILGRENNIGVACCGSSVIAYQVGLLQSLGVKEITVALDHDFRTLQDDSAKRLIKNLKNIQKKYGNYINISFIWDKNNLTTFKSSPTDCGSEIFFKLYKERVNLY